MPGIVLSPIKIIVSQRNMPLPVFSEWCFVYEIRCFMLHLRREMLKKFMLFVKREPGLWRNFSRTIVNLNTKDSFWWQLILDTDLVRYRATESDIWSGLIEIKGAMCNNWPLVLKTNRVQHITRVNANRC